jgi:hypothetical protein
MMPAFPVFVLLIASLPLLLPHAPGKLRDWRPAFAAPRPRTGWGTVSLAVLVTAVLPIGAFAMANTAGKLTPATIGTTIMPIPANVDLGVSSSVQGRRVTLQWNADRPLGGPVFYRIWRGRTDGLSCPPGAGGRLCNLVLPEIGTTHAGHFVDDAPKGTWVYRVAISANWLNDASYGDPYLVSSPVTVTVR